MTRPTRVWAQFKPCADETYAVSITIGNDYPDALDQARATATRMMRDMIDHAATVFPTEASTTD